MATLTTRDGVALVYEVHGAVEAAPVTVVLVHGWAGNRSYWEHQVSSLADRYRIVALDLAGHGESGLGRTGWSLPALGDDVVAVVEAVGALRVALVGQSMGGDMRVTASRVGGPAHG